MELDSYNNVNEYWTMDLILKQLQIIFNEDAVLFLLGLKYA